MKSIMSDECPWSVVAASTVGWAKRLFPELDAFKESLLTSMG